MSCNKPLFRIDALKLPSRYKSLPYIHNGGLIFGQDQYSRFAHLVNPEDVISIPCGSCLGCRLEYSKMWAIRCMLEAQYYENNYFVTLTYNDQFLPRGNFLDPGDSFSVKDNSLLLSDVQKFLKRLRERSKTLFNHDGIRVFYSGEYGDLQDRAHYHMILFNMPKLDLTLFSKNGSYNYYRSSFLESCWSSRLGLSMGFVMVTDFTFETAAYVARYMLKKQKGHTIRVANDISKDLPDGFSIRANPFAHQSRKPGLAYSYYKDHNFDIYLNGEYSVPYTKDYQLFLAKPPHYFDRLFDTEFLGSSDILSDLKLNSRLAANSVRSTASLDLFESLDKREDLLSRKERKRGIKL